MKFDEVPFVPCNDCTAYESCTQEAYEQGKKDAQEECERCIYSGKKPFMQYDVDDFSNTNPDYKSLAEIRRDAYTEGFAKGKADGRKKAIDECIKIVAQETHDGTLCDLLEELKGAEK